MAAQVFGDVGLDMRQPLPIARALVHYWFGIPALGGRRWFKRLMDAWDRGCAAVLPRSHWAYILVTCTPPAADGEMERSSSGAAFVLGQDQESGPAAS